MRSHVADSNGLSSRARRGHSGWRRHLARRNAAGKAAANLIGRPQVTASECAGSFDQYARAFVTRRMRRVYIENTLGAVGGPPSDKTSIRFVQRLR